MLLKAVYCERLKCKGTLIWPAFLLIPVIPILLGAGNYMANIELLRSEWHSYWTQATLFYASFFFAPLIGAYCAFLWRYERFYGCRNLLFAQPVSCGIIYMSKFILVCILSLLTQVWFTALFIASGKIMGLPDFPPGHILFWIFRGLAGGLVIAALQFLIASQVKSFATPIALGLAGGVTGLLAAGARLGILWPYSQMLLGMNSNKSLDVLGERAGLFWGICGIYILLASLAGVGRIKGAGWE